MDKKAGYGNVYSKAYTESVGSRSVSVITLVFCDIITNKFIMSRNIR